MSYRIIGDSCTDLPDGLRKDEHFKLVPLTLTVDNTVINDNLSFDQKDFLKRIRESQGCPQSACPSPDDYMREFDYNGDIYVVTLSSGLSGSYNSAELAKRLYLEENPHKKIEIIDSRSASVGQTLISMKLKELIEAGHRFDSVIKKINEFRDGLKTKFVLESLDILKKNGRLSGIQAVICNVLNIKPIMGGTSEGTICKLDQTRGIVKALISMAKMIERDVIKPYEKILAIAHCNNRERAQYIRDEILKRVPFKDSVIVETAGVSTMYANDGGIIVAY